MARRQYSNIAIDTTLNSGITSGASSLTVADATGWPSAPFILAVEPDTADEELILVGAKSGTTFSSLTRGYGGTSAVAHDGGDVVKHIIAAEDLSFVWTHAHDGADDSAQVSHDDLTDVSTDDHHAQVHAHDGVDGSGTVSHDDLTDVSADDHHTENHASRHSPGQADEFLHASEHIAGGGDPIAFPSELDIILSEFYHSGFDPGATYSDYGTSYPIFRPVGWTTMDFVLRVTVTGKKETAGTDQLRFRVVTLDELVTLLPEVEINVSSTPITISTAVAFQDYDDDYTVKFQVRGDTDAAIYSMCIEAIGLRKS